FRSGARRRATSQRAHADRSGGRFHPGGDRAGTLARLHPAHPRPHHPAGGNSGDLLPEHSLLRATGRRPGERLTTKKPAPGRAGFRREGNSLGGFAPPHEALTAKENAYTQEHVNRRFRNGREREAINSQAIVRSSGIKIIPANPNRPTIG